MLTQLKRSHEGDGNTNDDSFNKKPRPSGQDDTTAHMDDQFSGIFDDPLPDFSSTADGVQQRGNSDIQFNDMPMRFLDEGENKNAFKPTGDVNGPRASFKLDNTSMGRNDTSGMPVSSNGVPGYTKTLPPTGQTLFQAPLAASKSNMNVTLTMPSGGPTSGREGESAKSKPEDASKLNDAIAAAGVNIQHEEEILLQQQQNRRTDVSRDLKQFIKSSKPPAYLNPYHVAGFMNKIARENGIQQNFFQDSEMLDLVSSACEYWLANILTKTLLLSRHRRRGIPAVAPTNTSASKNKKQAPNPQRSELTRELRNIALKQKELEEKRVTKRVLLGLEKSGAEAAAEQGEGKAGAEETLHRAANATAAMMTLTGRKKYSWMTSAAGGSETNGPGSEQEGKSKQSALISLRGDNGLRFREIRTGNQVTVKDLLGVLEDERMGTEKAIIKGYARLKD